MTSREVDKLTKPYLTNTEMVSTLMMSREVLTHGKWVLILLVKERLLGRDRGLWDAEIGCGRFQREGLEHAVAWRPMRGQSVGGGGWRVKGSQCGLLGNQGREVLGAGARVRGGPPRGHFCPGWV